MLSIEFDGMCKGCRCADIHVEGYKVDAFFDSSSEMRYEVACSHQDAC